MTTSSTVRPKRAWLQSTDCILEEFIACISERVRKEDYPLAVAVDREVLIYDSAKLLIESGTPDGRRSVQAELVRALSDGPGIVVFKDAYTDLDLVDRTTAAFHALIAEQRASGQVGGDHFAKPGANDRVWNALEKLAVSDPTTFAQYYSNDILALVSVAWLGPGYQVTSQVNVVNPGGRHQDAHRDYHLGFMDESQAALYPAHVHTLSPTMTLQGAVAHSDMPVESGPTLYLPHSQKYEEGYLAFHRPEFREYFEANFVQLPLAKGDAAFFNPALFHGAGDNDSADIRRMANLLQVSSAFGRAMETVDRARVSQSVYPALLELKAAGSSSQEIANAIAASAEGYAFPSNLDRDQPIDGMAPETQAQLLARAVAGSWEVDQLESELVANTERHMS